MKIAITGGAGFVGSHLTRAYLDAGHDVLVIDSLVSDATRVIDPRARLYPIDIRDERLRTILQLERPDIVSHHAAQRAALLPGEQSLNDADVQVRGLLHLLDACIQSDTVRKVIFASSGNTLYRGIPLSEYIEGVVAPLKEDATLYPVSPTDISKVAGEWYVRYYTRQYGLEHTILRYADIYGETACRESRFACHPLTDFLVSLARKLPPIIRGSAQEVRDHIHIDDVVQANLSALEHGQNATLHISSGRGYTPYQFFCAAAQALSSDLLPVHISDGLNEPTATVLDNGLARHLLGWKPSVSFSEGIRRTVEQLQDNMVHSPVEKQAQQHVPMHEPVPV